MQKKCQETQAVDHHLRELRDQYLAASKREADVKATPGKFVSRKEGPRDYRVWRQT